MSRRILVTGASVAGCASAWWLARSGIDVTVLERAPAFRDGGQNVDLRGVGREVVRQMGLEREVLARGTGERGTAWVDRRGRVVARFVTEELGHDGPTAEMEILRGDLARLLFEAVREGADFCFGEAIEAVETGEGGATVGLAGGGTERFDLVVVAEGVGSRTRDLVFANENQPRWMDLAIAYFTIPRVADDDRMWRWYNATGGRSVSLRPDTHGTTRAMLSLRRTERDADGWDVARQKSFLRAQFAGAGWQTERVLAGLADTDDFYFDTLRQVRMPRWHSGRVVLTGDAAWCVTPLGGVGTSLAVTGARVLAGELARGTDMDAALLAYERAMRRW